MPTRLRFLLCVLLASYLASPWTAAAEAGPEDAIKRRLLEKSLTIYELDREIEALSAHEARLNQRIEETRRAADEAERLAKQRKLHAGKIIQSYYTGDRSSLWLAAFSAGSISDAIYVWEHIQIILARDQKTIDEYVAVHRTKKEALASLDADRNRLMDVKAAYIAEKERRSGLQRELDAELAGRSNRRELERDMEQMRVQWEEQGLPLFERYFSALAKVMSQLPDLLLKSDGMLAIKGLNYSIRIGDEDLNRFIHSKNSSLADFAFRFGDDHIAAGGRSEGNAVTLTGRYAIEAKPVNAIKFQIDTLTYNGLLLPDATAKSLEQKFDLSFYPHKIVPFLHASDVKTERGLLTIALKLSF